MAPAGDGAVLRRSPAGASRRAAANSWMVAGADALLSGVDGHWLLLANALTLLLVIGPIATPILLAGGLTGPAMALYHAFHALCHQWAFRSFFLLGPQTTYSRDQLGSLGVDPFTFVGEARTGWKMAFCERNLAIVGGLFVFGVLYAARGRPAGVRPASYLLYAVLIAPMAIDGLTQLAGWRESTWELRLATGALFGLASAWFLYPRFACGARTD